MRKCIHEPVHPLTHGVMCQIGAIAEFATKPASELTSTELSALLASLLQAAYQVETRMGWVATFGTDDHGRAA
jgi:hypothetical protein